MTDYSPRSRELAKELREKAIGNLEKSGYTVRQSSTGRFVTSRSTKNSKGTAVHGKDGGRAAATSAG